MTYSSPGKNVTYLRAFVNRVARCAVADYWRKKYTTHEVTVSEWEQYAFPMDSMESMTAGIAEAQLDEMLKFATGKAATMLEAAREVVAEGVDPLDTRAFYNAIYKWLQENRSDLSISRESIRVYWNHLSRWAKMTFNEDFEQGGSE